MAWGRRRGVERAVLGTFKAFELAYILGPNSPCLCSVFQLESLLPQGQTPDVSSRTVESGSEREDVEVFSGLSR